MRIVSLTCSNTEIVWALGAADWLVGVDDHSDFPAEVVSRLPRVGPDLDIDVERVRALAPDLVLASLTVPGHERIVERLQRARLPFLATEQEHGIQAFDGNDRLRRLPDRRRRADGGCRVARGAEASEESGDDERPDACTQRTSAVVDRRAQ